MSNPAVITIPIVLDASASATLFAEASPIADSSYIFTMTSSALTATDLSNFIQYIDQDSGDTLFTYSTSGMFDVSTNLHTDLCNQSLTFLQSSPNNFPNHTSSISNATIGEMMVKYIASVLFGHPEAQAPIKNDAAIIHSVQTTSNIYGQFVDAISEDLSANATTAEDGRSNDVVLSIFEQLVAHSSEIDASAGSSVDVNRFGDISHNEQYTGIPFRTGDTIVFLVNMTGSLTTDGQNTLGSNFNVQAVPSISTLFSDNPDLNGDNLVPKIWELRITLGEPVVPEGDPVV